MSVGIVLGLGAALAWGLSDYVAARASHAIGALRVVLGFHLCATALLVVVAVPAAALEGVDRRDVLYFAVVGALGWVAYLTFFRALAIGPISIVSPIVSGYAAVTVILAVLVGGERLSAAQVAAIVVAMSGVVFAATDPSAILRERIRRKSGVVLAFAAMALLGSFVFGVADRSNELGWLAPIVLARLFSTLFVAAHATRVRAWGHTGWRPKLLAAVALVAVLDTVGFVFFNVGVRHEDTSIVATASAPYSLVAIVLAVSLLRERPSWTQWAGIALVISGLVLLGLVSG